MSVHGGLDSITEIRRLGGERLAAASDALRSNIQKVIFRANGKGSRLLVRCFLHNSCHFFSVDAWLTHATYHRPTRAQ